MIDVKNILAFLSAVGANNNREWFADNRAWYEQVKADFETIIGKLIIEIAQFDEDIKTVQVKDCTFRIYCDTRFHKNLPYKTHMGAYIASRGGRKSPRGGYYFHLEPGSCFASAGVWQPEPPVLKALREAVYENIDEFKEIIAEKNFAKYYKNSFHEDDMLKTAPKGFPKDFEDLYYLRLKHYIVNRNLSEKFFENEDFVKNIVEIFKTAYPFNKFLNFTIDETLNF
ncbi:TIGR02453 family protein [Bacteroidia bacterium]|nr:TIGR02453 family protein [Bacteroidia bacterium]